MTNSAPAWETLDDINAAVRAAGLKEPSSFQLERWRNAHLLPPVRQLPDDYHGRRQSNSIRRRVARHARSQATIYAARARHSVNAIERLCL